MNFERIASLLVTALQLSIAWKLRGAQMAMILLVLDIVLLGEIWFPKAMGDYLGGSITTKSPPGMLRWIGWIFLVGITVLLTVLLGMQ